MAENPGNNFGRTKLISVGGVGIYMKEKKEGWGWGEGGLGWGKEKKGGEKKKPPRGEKKN